MTISGILPLKNGSKLQYPYRLAIQSMRQLCDEIVVLVDPTSDDDTLEQVKQLKPDRIIESVWDTNNHYGHTNCEISIQTKKLCDLAQGDWIFSLQADEVLHENEITSIKRTIAIAEDKGITGIELERLYFFGSLDKIREDWTQWLLRLFRRNLWKPDVDGAMKFEPIGHQLRMRTDFAKIYHYSRIGDPKTIANRVRNLDGFFHAPEKIDADELPPYNFELRKLDSYVITHKNEIDSKARLIDFGVDRHPKAILEHFKLASNFQTS